MKKKIFFLVLLTLVVFLPKKTKAYCSDSEIVRLQKIASNVNINYTYNDKLNRFDIIITNLKKDLIIKDAYSNINYNTDKELIIHNVSSGTHKYYIYVKNKMCTSEILTTKYIKMPYYNNYSDYNECDEYKDKIYCQKWLNFQLTYDVWKNKIEEYNSKEQIIEEKEKKSVFDKYFEIISNIYVKYYYIILPSVIVVLTLIIYIKNKKESIV